MNTRKRMITAVFLACLAALVTTGGCVTTGGPVRGETPVLLETATATYLAGEYEGAVRSYTDFLGSNPSSTDAAEAYLGRGNCYYRLGRYALAEGDYRQAAQFSRASSVKAQATIGLANTVFAQERYNEAEKLYFRTARSYRGLVPQDEVLYRLGIALARQGEWDDALVYLRDVVVSWPAGEYAKFASAKLSNLEERRFTVQVGAFIKKALAESKAAELKAKGFPAEICEIDIAGVPGYAVRSGKFATWVSAGDHSTMLKRAGFSTYRLP